MKLLLLIPLLALVSCSTQIPAIHSSGWQAGADFFDNHRSDENMSFSVALLTDMENKGESGKVVFWTCEGREYFTALREIGRGVHQGPNPSRGYYTSRLETVLVTPKTIPWQRIHAILGSS